jgi:hypothetical protein
MKNLFLLLICSSFVFCMACAGQRHASLDTTQNGMVVHKDTNISLFQPSIDPIELSRANMYNAIAEQIRKDGAAASSDKFVGVIINEHTNKCAYVYHPELSTVVTIPPGNYEVFFVEQIPRSISLYFDKGYRTSRQVFQQSFTYNRIRMSWGARIW